jgi:hypothetical protein
VAEEVAVPELQDAELSRSKRPTPPGAKKPVEGAEGEAEEEVELTRPDDAFIEEQEEEDADVTDIIGGDIETEEGDSLIGRQDGMSSAICVRFCP